MTWVLARRRTMAASIRLLLLQDMHLVFALYGKFVLWGMGFIIIQITVGLLRYRRWQLTYSRGWDLGGYVGPGFEYDTAISDYRDAVIRGETPRAQDKFPTNVTESDMTNNWSNLFNVFEPNFWIFFYEIKKGVSPPSTPTVSTFANDPVFTFPTVAELREYYWMYDNTNAFISYMPEMSGLWNNGNVTLNNWDSLFNAFNVGGFWSWLNRGLSVAGGSTVRDMFTSNIFPLEIQMQYIYYAYNYIVLTSPVFTLPQSTPSPVPSTPSTTPPSTSGLLHVPVEIQVGYNTYTPVSVNFQLTPLRHMNVIDSSTDLTNDANATAVLSTMDTDIALVNTARNHVMAIDISNNFIAKFDADIEKWKQDSIDSTSEKMSCLSDQLELLKIYMSESENE